MMMDMTEIQAEIFEEAKSVLETLLNLMDMPSAVGISEEFTVVGEEGEASSVGLNIEGDDLGILIGRRGQTLATLQYMVRLIVGYKMQTRMPIVVDVEGYKWRRCEKLQALAWRIAEQVKAKKISFSLEPFKTTAAPASAISRAMFLPIPILDPVMRATCPFRSFTGSLLSITKESSAHPRRQGGRTVQRIPGLTTHRASHRPPH